MRHRKRHTNERVRAKERGGKEMEFFILMISVPLFLIIVFLFAVFVLANYPSREREPAKGAPSAGNPTETKEGTDNVIA